VNVPAQKATFLASSRFWDSGGVVGSFGRDGWDGACRRGPAMDTAAAVLVIVATVKVTGQCFVVWKDLTWGVCTVEHIRADCG